MNYETMGAGAEIVFFVLLVCFLVVFCMSPAILVMVVEAWVDKRRESKGGQS
jgi:hypothetical protein